jgi:hypothetical protein
MNFPNTQIPISYEALMASIYVNDRIFREKLAETDRFLSEKFAETDRQMKETAQQFKETERLMKETDRRFKETERLIKANSKEIGGISKSNGEVAESYFFNSFKKQPHFAGQTFQLIERNKRFYSADTLELKDEYDLIFYNGVAVAIIEVKYKAKKEDVKQALRKALTFKEYFPSYQDFSIYLGIAGLHVNVDAENEAKKQGVAVIKQVGKSMVINDAHLKVF